MYPISESAKQRFLKGGRQIARLTVINDEYEAYKGEVYTIPFSVEGTNIFTRENETDGKYLNGSGVETSNANYATSDYIEVEANKRYVVDNTPTDVNRYHAWYDSSKTLICVDHWKQECFISPIGAKYVRLSYIKSTAPTDMHIEVGTIVDGTLNVKTGVLTSNRGYISDLSKFFLSITSSTYTYIFMTNNISNAKNSTDSSERNQDIVSSDYKPSATLSVNASMENDGMLIIGNASAYFGSLRFRNNACDDDIGAFRTSAEGVQVIFPYKEPVTYQLTAKEVRTLLGYNNIYADTGTVNLSYRNTSGEVVTASGDMVSIDDGAKNIPLASLSLPIAYVQSGEGEPSPSNVRPITGYTEANVTRAGKNLYSGDNISLGGDNPRTTRFSVATIKAGTYNIACDNTGTTATNYGVQFFGSDGQMVGTKTGVTGAVVLSADAVEVYFYINQTDYDNGKVISLKDIKMQLASQTVQNLVINENKIIEGGLSVNRYCTTGKAVMVGSVVAGEMNAVLNNEDGAFNDVNFIGHDIKVEVGTMDGDTPDYIPLGYFQVDDSPKKLAHISLTTLDRMMLLEKNIDAEKLAFPMTVNSLFSIICNECGVTPASGQTLLNGDYEIEAYPENVQTYRDLLSCIAEISGTCAYFDWNGELRLEWFNPTPAVELNTHNRTSSDLAEESVIITGVEVKASDGDYLAGDDGFLLTVAQNPLITHDYQSVADSLYNARGNFGYRPFTAQTLPMPYLYPLDTATFIDKNGNESVVAITDWTFRLNRNTDLRGRGESTLQASFKKKYGLTEGGVSIDEAIGLLRETIIKNAEIVNQSMEELSRTLHGEYEAISSEFGTYRNETDAKITANAEGITQAYSNIEEIDSKYGVAVTDTNQAVLTLADGAVATNTKFRELTESYIKSGKLYYEGITPIYGVAVGQLTYEMVGGEQLLKRSGVYSVFTSEELAFYIDDVKVAYMRNKKLYINEAEFVAKVKVGRYSLEDGTNGFTIKYGG